MTEDVRDTRPVPDPTALTTAALYREIAQLRELVDTKLEVLDTKMAGYSEISAERLTKINEHFEEIEKIRGEQFRNISERFAQFDLLRIEQKRDAEVALTAALTAQRDAVAKQDEANQKAINKAEITTNDTLNKLEQLVNVKTDALRDRIDEVRTTANGTVQQKVGATESRSGMYAVIGVIATVLLALFTILGFALAHLP